MTQNVLAQQMRSAAIFEDLSADQLVEIALHADRRLFREGDLIAERGASGSHAILVVDGTFRCDAGIGAGNQFVDGQSGIVIGEMAMFLDDFEHPATFVATSRVKALQVNRTAMLQQMANDPDLAARLVEKVASRLAEMSGALRAIEQLSCSTVATIGATSMANDQTATHLV